MGRSGGGGHSSGGFSGGRSSGGFSGGGRSSFSGGGHGFSGGFGGSPVPPRAPRPPHHPRPPRPGFFGWGFFGFPVTPVSPAPAQSSSQNQPASTGNPPPKNSGNQPKLGCGTMVLIFILCIVALGFLNAAIRNFSAAISHRNSDYPLHGQVVKSEWYEDGLNWIGNGPALTEGLKKFYDETGVQPFVLFVPYDSAYWTGNTLNTDAATEYLEERYDDLFSDEAHFLFAYFSCRNDDSFEMDGDFRYLSGHLTDRIMDADALKVFWSYFEENYNDLTLTTEEMISNTFSDTARSLSSTHNSAGKIGSGVFSLIVTGVCVFFLIFIYRKHRAAVRAAQIEEVLNTPLETFGESVNDTADIEKKYE